MNCNLCGSNNRKFLFVKNSFEIFRCMQCGLIYADIEWTQDEVQKFYSKDYFVCCENTSAKCYLDYFEKEREALIANGKKRLKQIEYKQPPPGRLLDVGCACGYFVEIAQKNGWEAEGLDISEYATAYGRDTLGLKLQTTSLKVYESYCQKNYFDLITFWGVFDQLIDPKETLKAAYNLLKDNGLIVIRIPNADNLWVKLAGKQWHFFSPPAHIYYFTFKTIQTLLEEIGFKVCHIEKAGKFENLEYLFLRLNVLFKNKFSQMFYYIVQKFNLKKINFYINLGDVMHVYARKVGK